MVNKKLSKRNKDRIAYEILSYYLDSLNNGLDESLYKKSPLSGTLTNPTYFIVTNPKRKNYENKLRELNAHGLPKSFLYWGRGIDVFADILEDEVKHKAFAEKYELNSLRKNNRERSDYNWDYHKSEIVEWEISLLNREDISKGVVDLEVLVDEVVVPVKEVPVNTNFNELNQIKGFMDYYYKFRDSLKYNAGRVLGISTEYLTEEGIDFVIHGIAENIYKEKDALRIALFFK